MIYLGYVVAFTEASDPSRWRVTTPTHDIGMATQLAAVLDSIGGFAVLGVRKEWRDEARPARPVECVKNCRKDLITGSTCLYCGRTKWPGTKGRDDG